MEHTEKSIQKALNGFLSSWKYNVNNLYVFHWESDKLIWTKAGFIYEFEIKVSRSDFRNDFKHKPEKHATLNETFESQQSAITEGASTSTRKTPNYFYYATPQDLVSPDEVPTYAGLVYIDNIGEVRLVKKAPKIHCEKYGDDELSLAPKFYFNMMSWRNKYESEANYASSVKRLLDKELSRNGQDIPYSSLKSELEAVKGEMEKYRNLYYDMVEGADFNTIERHMLIDELRRRDKDFDFNALSKKAEDEYDRRYPNRK